MPGRATGSTIGGWLTIRYRPSTCSASFDSACKLSRVCAFSGGLLGALLGRLVDGLLLRPLLRTGRVVDGACSSSSSDTCAYQISSVPISANRPSPPGTPVTEASVAARASAFVKPLLRAAIVKLAAMRLTSYSNGPGQRLVEVVQVEQQRSLRRRVHTEVREMRVAAELHIETRRRRVLQISRHDLRRPAVERERRHHHPPVPNRHEVGLPRCVLLLEQRDRIGPAGGRLPSGMIATAVSGRARPSQLRLVRQRPDARWWSRCSSSHAVVDGARLAKACPHRCAPRGSE